MMRNFFSASEFRERRLVFFDAPVPEKNVPPPGQEPVPEKSATAVEEFDVTNLSNEELLKEIEPLLLKTLVMLHTEWEKTLICLEKDLCDAIQVHEDTHAKSRADKYEKRGNDHSPGAHDTQRSAEFRALEKQLATRVQELQACIQSWIQQEPTMAHATYALAGVPFPRAGEQPVPQTSETPDVHDVLPAGLSGKVYAAFVEFEKSLTDDERETLRTMGDVFIAIRDSGVSNETLADYISTIKADDRTLAENGLPEANRDKLNKFILKIYKNQNQRNLLEKFLRQYGDTILEGTNTVEVGKSYLLSSESDNDVKTRVLGHLADLAKPETQANDKQKKIIEAQLMIAGVDISTVNLEGTGNTEFNVMMLPKDGGMRAWMCILGCIQLFDIMWKKEEEKKAEEKRKEKERVDTESMTVEDLGKKIDENKKRIAVIPEEKKKVGEELLTEEGKLMSLEAGDKNDAERALLQENIDQKKAQIKNLEEESKKLEQENVDLEKVLEEKKKKAKEEYDKDPEKDSTKEQTERDKKLERELREIQSTKNKSEFTVVDGTLVIKPISNTTDDVFIVNDKATLLPSIREIQGGDLDISPPSVMRELPNSLQKISGEVFARNNTALATIPDNLKIGDDLNIEGCTNLASLPNGLDVGENLTVGNLQDNMLKTVGNNIHIGGDLRIWPGDQLNSISNFFTFLDTFTKVDPKIDGKIIVEDEIFKQSWSEAKGSFMSSHSSWKDKIVWPEEKENPKKDEGEPQEDDSKEQEIDPIRYGNDSFSRLNASAKELPEDDLELGSYKVFEGVILNVLSDKDGKPASCDVMVDGEMYEWPTGSADLFAAQLDYVDYGEENSFVITKTDTSIQLSTNAQKIIVSRLNNGNIEVSDQIVPGAPVKKIYARKAAIEEKPESYKFEGDSTELEKILRAVPQDEMSAYLYRGYMRTDPTDFNKLLDGKKGITIGFVPGYETEARNLCVSLGLPNPQEVVPQYSELRIDHNIEVTTEMLEKLKASPYLISAESAWIDADPTP